MRFMDSRQTSIGSNERSFMDMEQQGFCVDHRFRVSCVMYVCQKIKVCLCFAYDKYSFCDVIETDMHADFPLTSWQEASPGPMRGLFGNAYWHRR